MRLTVTGLGGSPLSGISAANPSLSVDNMKRLQIVEFEGVFYFVRPAWIYYRNEFILIDE
ncbi:hypothetical protein GCM10022209_46250 [Chitinophaga oryziterrae]